ncbi:MAG: hypothetical protein PHO87_04500 [Acholeplasmataceae bacterium]|nr:hypothetical protein [Acholeplasmataceae bacterium]
MISIFGLRILTGKDIQTMNENAIDLEVFVNKVLELFLNQAVIMVNLQKQIDLLNKPKRGKKK